MTNQITSPGEHHYYTLPLEAGTVKLTLDTLNKHSEFRFSERFYLVIRLRLISFQNEVLTLGTQLGEEKEERVYIRVLQTELRISCSVDTDDTYLSRYAYFTLYHLMSVRKQYDFNKYYWPDFFDPKTGKSKYLTVINDRAGMDIKRKPKYAFFYKPGQKLIHYFRHKLVNATPAMVIQEDHINDMNSFAIGYCLADTCLSARHSNHFPFLVPYTGNWKENKAGIKGFHLFLTSPDQIAAFDYTPKQKKMNTICRKMLSLSPIKSLANITDEKEIRKIKRGNISTMRQVYALWQKAVPLLKGQPFTHWLYTYGMHNVKGKPRRMDMQPSIFSTVRPELCFLLVDKGEYYELELRFKAEGKMYVPSDFNPTFFIHSEAKPNLFYLLDSITDYHVICFFTKCNFKLSVLKCHYQAHFKNFIEQLAAVYELKSKGVNVKKP